MKTFGLRGLYVALCIAISALLTSSFLHAADYSKLYTDKAQLDYEDLVVNVKGYKVPTRAAFRGWMLMNHAEKQVQEIADMLIAAGITEVEGQTMPLHLILLQGTNWALNDTSVFTLPDKKNIQNMVTTVKFIQEHVEPITGPLIPVSGERSTIYNQTSGGASRSKHMVFCALDLVPIEDLSREELHKKLWSIYKSVGAENKMGLGLYSGVRFHIDTCGHRNW